MISNGSEPFITTPDVFKMCLDRIPGILINLKQFESNSYFEQVSVNLGIWDSGNLTSRQSDNLKLGKLMFCGFDNLKFAV